VIQLFKDLKDLKGPQDLQATEFQGLKDLQEREVIRALLVHPVMVPLVLLAPPVLLAKMVLLVHKDTV
jgi:hypothetical protein